MPGAGQLLGGLGQQPVNGRGAPHGPASSGGHTIRNQGRGNVGNPDATCSHAEDAFAGLIRNIVRAPNRTPSTFRWVMLPRSSD